jgi:hypothetical protein
MLKISAGFLVEVQLSVCIFYIQMYKCHYQCSHKKVDFISCVQKISAGFLVEVQLSVHLT